MLYKNQRCIDKEYRIYVPKNDAWREVKDFNYLGSQLLYGHSTFQDFIKEVMKRVPEDIRIYVDSNSRHSQIKKVDLYWKAHQVGTLMYGDYKKRKKGETDDSPMFGVEHLQIRNQRYPYNQKTSFKMRDVIKVAVNVLKKPQHPTNEFVAEARRRAMDLYDRSRRTVLDDSPLGRESLEETIAIVKYLYQADERGINQKIDGSIIEPMVTPENKDARESFVTRLKNYRILTEMKNLIKDCKGLFVRTYLDGCIEVMRKNPDDSHELLATSYDMQGLPKLVQDKLPLLKFTKPKTVIRNIGINLRTGGRYSDDDKELCDDDYYFITDLPMETIQAMEDNS